MDINSVILKLFLKFRTQFADLWVLSVVSLFKNPILEFAVLNLFHKVIPILSSEVISQLDDLTDQVKGYMDQVLIFHYQKLLASLQKLPFLHHLKYLSSLRKCHQTRKYVAKLNPYPIFHLCQQHVLQLFNHLAVLIVQQWRRWNSLNCKIW